ncbi:hypothetical protein BDZ94DRAFT_1246177 [Collybia nuda]|uniref:FIST domain-containing protein n=1 Tax=Collybia nuda TaxID=64659 RepID=A0A9P6CNY3_9AGAR|nr:hypothetical protein BDZ94DRAFT_1246177 [Collybia nuda]
MSIHASTVLARSSTAILSHITQLSKLYPDHPLAFSLSPNVQPQDLSKLVKSLTEFSSQSIGCLSAPLPGSTSQNLISCSLAIFDPEQTVLFRSEIAGKASPQVGRWHAFRKKDDPPSQIEGQEELKEGVNWGDVWNRNTADTPLPPELQTLNTNSVNEVIFFSDRAPEGLNNSLKAFASASKLGLFAASTPFITGRPFTLFHNKSIYESGAVGLVLKNTSWSRRAIARSEFIGLSPISPQMIVTKCEGNMVNSLDKSNPAQLLLDAMEKSGMDMAGYTSFKDGEKFSLGTIKNEKLSQIYNITAGDPSRGNISLESQNAPIVGTKVQFFHRPKSGLEIPKRFSSASPKTLAFIVSPESSPKINDDPETDEISHLLPDTFLASSENGFVMSRSDGKVEPAWACTVPGGLASLEWS